MHLGASTVLQSARFGPSLDGFTHDFDMTESEKSVFKVGGVEDAKRCVRRDIEHKCIIEETQVA